VRLPFFGIRAQTTLVASVVVGVVLAIGVGIFVFLMTHALRSSIESAAETRAEDVALLAASSSLPSSLPGRGDSLLVQVIVDDRVIAASPELGAHTPLLKLSLSPGRTLSKQLASLPDLEKHPGLDVDPGTPFLVVGRGVTTPHGQGTIVVASPLSPLEDTIDTLLPLLVASAVLALVLVAVVTWFLTGMALRPVSAIQAQAEMISSSTPSERLPVPRAHDEIRDLAETMNRMLQRIDTSVTAQKRFISDASHELKSPVAAIRTMLEVAHAKPSAVDMSTLLDDVAAENERLELLVADLLLLATTDEGGLRLNSSDFDLARTVAEEISSMTPRTSTSIDLVLGCAPQAHADEIRIRQLLRNLLDNATRHARKRVWVNLACTNGEAKIVIADDGPGISPDARERVFERFVRIDEGRGRAGGGTGLGLPVSRAIASAHGGAIEVVDSAHGGAAFEVTLPILDHGEG